MSTKLLTPEEVLDNWPFLKEHLEKSLAHSAGESSAYDWFKKTQSYQAFIIIVHDNEDIQNITLFQFIEYEQHRSLHIVTSTGVGNSKWKDYYLAHEEIDKIAKANDCKRIEMWGRKGWERLLPRLGYTRQYVVMSKEI